MLCLHVVYSPVHSREIMDSLIMAKYCRCILNYNLTSMVPFSVQPETDLRGIEIS